MRRAIPLVVVAILAGGCGGGDPGAPVAGPDVKDDRATAKAGNESPRCLAGTTRSLAGRGAAAVLRRATTAHSSPGGPVVARFDRLNQNGVPTAFMVLDAKLAADCRPSWYRVQLPIRPNGVTGWIQANAASRYRVDFRIVVDLSERRVTVYRSGSTVAQTSTAIGRSDTPTPTGRFYVNQRLLAADPTGPWGPGGIGISAFSPVLTGWMQGGPIAIHGTNRPETIGHAASNGCLRIDNALLERLIHQIPNGTPVTIRS